MTEDDLTEEQLRDIREMAAMLPREIEPPADAWLGVKAAIEAPRVAAAPAFWQRPAFLAAAALLLVASSSAVTAIAINGRSVTQAPAASTVVVASPPGESTLAEFARMENDYIGTANRLSAMLESDQMQLSPATLAKMKESLRVIDAAILEARRALAEDPANSELAEMLSATYGKKIDFLRRTTEMGRS